MGARPMERETRVERKYRSGWEACMFAHRLDGTCMGYGNTRDTPHRTVERFVTPWTPVEEGKQ